MAQRRWTEGTLSRRKARQNRRKEEAFDKVASQGFSVREIKRVVARDDPGEAVSRFAQGLHAFTGASPDIIKAYAGNWDQAVRAKGHVEMSKVIIRINNYLYMKEGAIITKGSKDAFHPGTRILISGAAVDPTRLMDSAPEESVVSVVDEEFTGILRLAYHQLMADEPGWLAVRRFCETYKFRHDHRHSREAENDDICWAVAKALRSYPSPHRLNYEAALGDSAGPNLKRLGKPEEATCRRAVARCFATWTTDDQEVMHFRRRLPDWDPSVDELKGELWAAFTSYYLKRDRGLSVDVLA